MKTIILSYFLIFLLCISSKTIAQINNVDKEKVQKIYNLIKNENIQYPEFVIAQSIVETGWMKCKNCCYKFHNLFGFIGPGNKCLKFDTDYASIQYYKKCSAIQTIISDSDSQTIKDTKKNAIKECDKLDEYYDDGVTTSEADCEIK